MLIEVYLHGKHYPSCEEWRSLQGWPSLPQDVLTDGLVVPGVAMMWAFYSQNTMCQLGFLTTNPTSSKADKARATRLLIQEHIAQAKKLGYKHIEVVTSNKSLINSYKKFGFKEGEMGCSHLLLSTEGNFLE